MKKSTLLILCCIFMTLILSACGSKTTELNQDQVVAFAMQTIDARTAQTQDAAVILRPITYTATSLPQPTAVPPTAIPTAVPRRVITQPTAQANYVQPVSGVCERVRFIEDITIPDNTVVQPGQQFRKTWRVQNAGTCSWDSRYQLVFVSGDPLGKLYAINLPGLIPSGATTDISLDMVAPSTQGVYQSNWMMRSPSGNIFGTSATDNNAIWAKVVVSSTAALSTVAPGIPSRNSYCTLLSLEPSYKKVFSHGQDIDISFKVRNDSDYIWDSKNYDIAVISGENFLKYQGTPRRDLPYDVNPGQSLSYTLDALVPDDPGTYTMTLGIVREMEILCSIDVTINVKW